MAARTVKGEQMAEKKALGYEALVGLAYPPDKRVDAGDTVSDLPASSLKWLLDQGLVRPVEETGGEG
jgi:hypothetical protein